MAYYNEFDPYAAQWLRNLIQAGHIAPGVVDERSIQDVTAGDVAGFTQCHFFAGIGIWSLALRRAGWSDARPVWTMSCPCQPFSAAGTGAGFDDERHLWPDAFHLITQCTPPIIFGEQVASKAVGPWIDLVHADLEALEYAFGCVAFPSAGVGAPHIRDRAYWVAHSPNLGQSPRNSFCGAEGGRTRPGTETNRYSHPSGMAYATSFRERTNEFRSDCRTRVELARAEPGCHSGDNGSDVKQKPQSGPVNGKWRDADWLFCRDGKWRPVEPGTFPLAHGASSRVGRLRAYGNAINAETAKEFILAYLEQPQMIYLTPYDTSTLQCTGPSTDSGFTSLDEVRELMGEPDMAHPRMLTYGDSCFTDFPISLENPE